MSELRRLDDRLVPPAARLARAAALRYQRLQARAAATRAAAGDYRPPARLTRSWASRPAVLRGASGTTVLVLLAVLLLDLTAVATFRPPAPVFTAATCAPASPAVASIGPVPGERVDHYLARAACRLNALVTADPPSARTYAVVDFLRYRTPSQAAALLAGLHVDDVLLHRPGTGLVHLVPVSTPLPAGATAAMRSTGSADQLEAARLRATLLLQKRRGSGPSTILDSFARLADDYAAEGTGFLRGCACVFAAVVQARVVDLHRLARTTGVRAVDPAPVSTGFDQTFTGLYPDDEGTVRVLNPLFRQL